MATHNEVLEQIDVRLTEALSLTVGRMVDGALDAQHIALDGPAANVLREQCRDARGRIYSGMARSYAATAEIESGEYFLIDDEETLEELDVFRSHARSIGGMPQTSAQHLDPSIKLYTVAIGNDSRAQDLTDNRVVFVRKTNPHLRPKAGGFLAVLRERLTYIEGPMFAFASSFDFVIGPDWAVVLNQREFEMLFRELGVVEAHIDSWISGITNHLPMNAASVVELKNVALRDSRTWRRLRDIKRRGHLAGVNLNQVKHYAVGVGLDPNRIVSNGQLTFDPAERFGFLHLLNEDLYNGPLTGESFESQRKAAMN